MADDPDITALLRNLDLRARPALESLFPIVYNELRQLAQAHLRGERSDHTLQPTALANEAYLKLARQNTVSWQDRRHFFAAAGQAMRRILVDHARGLGRRKRAGHRIALEINSLGSSADGGSPDFVALDEVLRKLSTEAPRKARVVELRFFSGLSEEEVASLLGVTTRTVERDWRYARAWLFRELELRAEG